MSAGTFQYDVFLSHSSKDKAVVRPLAQRLRKDGVKVWIDEWVLKPDDSIPAKIDPPSLPNSRGTREGIAEARVRACPAVADRRRRKAGTFRSRDPLNKERRFLPLRLDDALTKGSNSRT